MTQDERIRRAQHAEHLRNDDLLAEACKTIEEYFVAVLIDSGPKDTKEREDAIRCLQIASKWQEFLLSVVQEGRAEAKMLEQDKSGLKWW